VSLDSKVKHQFPQWSNLLDGVPKSVKSHQSLDHMNFATLGIHEACTVGIGIPHDLELIFGELNLLGLDGDDAHSVVVFLV
jgi:hypothetical protein